MTDTTQDTTVTRNDAEERYEIHVGDVLGGFTDFERDSRGRLVFPNTQIDPAFKGRGLASSLVAEAMSDSARRDETVVPRCSFVARYLKEHDVPGLLIDWPDNGGGDSQAADRPQE